ARNAERVASTRGLPDAVTHITVREGQIIVSDRSGGFIEDATFAALEKGASGEGKDIIAALTRLHGWRITRAPVDGGTEFTLHI
ncbi:MAG: hypothetical protein Q7S68_03270, partial [Deltaproteobacteria bacterium]|nr:hypothetical protein [Deltaproteobacteria bacterium]